MPHPDWPVVTLVVAGAALLASFLAAVAGFGGAVVLLPVLVWAFGVREAVPILTVVQVVGNAARVVFNRGELVWPVAGWFALGAVPLAVLAACSSPLRRLPASHACSGLSCCRRSCTAGRG